MKILGFLGLCALNMTFADFLAAWGPSPLSEMYVPNFKDGQVSGEFFVLLILYGPILYLGVLMASYLANAAKRKR